MPTPAFANASVSLAPADGDRLPATLEQEIRRIYERSPIYGQRFPLHPDPCSGPVIASCRSWPRATS